MSAKEKCKITIITATYNSAETLEQTIASVAMQDYPYVEYIIVDGASTDGTVDIIKKYDNKIPIKWISEKDAGIYDAFNKGINMATGDYINFLGSDDSLCNVSTISDVVDHLEENTDILSAAIMVIDEESLTQYPSYNHHALDKTAYHGGMIPHPGMFVKTSLMRKHKFDLGYKIAADYKFFLQCYYDNNVVFKYIDEPVVYFTNSGSSSNMTKCWEENNRIYVELGLPFRAPSIDSPILWERFARIILWKIGVLSSSIKIADYCRRKIKGHFVWERHTCANPICRWCGRKDIGNLE